MNIYSRILSSIFLLPTLCFIISCSQQGAEINSARETEDGAILVKNPANPVYRDMQIVFTENLTIGVKDGDENYMFGNKIFVNADASGNIYVADQDKRIVRKYDAQGIYLQSIGRPGQGPGEFQNISKVRFDKAGSIYLYDDKNQRISWLTKEGNYELGIRAIAFFESVVINSQGHFIARNVDNVELGNSKKWDYVYGLFDDKFNLYAEFLRLPQEAYNKSPKSAAHAFADYLSGIAFVPYASYSLDNNDLIYFGYPTQYEIKVYSPVGELKTIIQRDHDPIVVNAEHKELFERNLDRQLFSKMQSQDEQEVFEFIQYPKYKPAYEYFVLMENGWIFVVVDSYHAEYTLIDIFSKDGKYLAQFKTDIPTEDLTFKNGMLYTIATIDDFKFVKRYKFEILGGPHSD